MMYHRATTFSWLAAVLCSLAVAMRSAQSADQEIGVREILARYGIGPAELDQFADGQAIGPAEKELLIGILQRMPRLGLTEIERWRRSDVTLEELSAAPDEHRADFVRLEGRAIEVVKHDLPAEQAAIVEYDHYYAVTLELDKPPYQAVIYTRTIPAAWEAATWSARSASGKDRAGGDQPIPSPDEPTSRALPPLAERADHMEQPLDERAAVDGLFLKMGSTHAGQKQLLFAAPRLAWLPDRPRPELSIGPDQVALAQAGFDIGLLDDVRKTNRSGLVGADREAFYQLLHALDQTHPTAVQTTQLDIFSLLDKPAPLQGKTFPVEGLARRVLRVNVSDPDVQARFGIDHYYEIDLFLPLGDKRLRFGDAQAAGPTYANSFPATLIVRRVPPGLEVGDNLRQAIYADAVFFKLWSYSSAYTQQFDQLQAAPLFLATDLELVPVTAGDNWLWNFTLAAAIAVLMALVAFVFWRYRRADLAYSAERKRNLIDEAPPPDFSGL